jgi:hypothetical protein
MGEQGIQNQTTIPGNVILHIFAFENFSSLLLAHHDR